MRRPSIVLAVCALSTFGSGCGSRLEEERPVVGEEPSPLAVYDLSATPTGESCPREASVSAEDVLRPREPTDAIDVVSVTYESECTGAGGDWFLASSVKEPAVRYVLGGHGCREWHSDARPPFGVLRYRPSASTRQVPAGACVGTETNQARGIETASRTLGLALFSTRTEADAFARSIR